jgi:DNA-binding NtrC family response regulator
VSKRNQLDSPDSFTGSRKSDRSSEALYDRVQSLGVLTLDLTAEIESLQLCDFPIELPSFEDTVDFYREVRNFEIFLIKQALKRTVGSQVKAASLLKLDPTTLNRKIKSYKIIP